MSCFSLYSINFYNEALQNIDRFLTTYPSDKNVIYAEYLKAVIFFEQISDEKKDIKPLLDATAQIDIFLIKYPSSDYAVDLKFKKNLIQNQLSAKELYIAKYYISVQKWVAAINRLKTIVEKYDETIFIEEALHRLVEIHYYLGLDEEAKSYAKILGYNYNSSEWYKQSYKIINNDYDYNDKINEDKKKDNDNFIKKIIKIIK
jgi:outer membrane protein assembly factor BamD